MSRIGNENCIRILEDIQFCSRLVSSYVQSPTQIMGEFYINEKIHCRDDRRPILFWLYLPHSVATDQAYHISIVSLPVLSLQFAYSLPAAPSYCSMQPHRPSIASTLLLLPPPMTLIPNQCHCQHKSLHHLHE